MEALPRDEPQWDVIEPFDVPKEQLDHMSKSWEGLRIDDPLLDLEAHQLYTQEMVDRFWEIDPSKTPFVQLSPKNPKVEKFINWAIKNEVFPKV